MADAGVVHPDVRAAAGGDVDDMAEIVGDRVLGLDAGYAPRHLALSMESLSRDVAAQNTTFSATTWGQFESDTGEAITIQGIP